MELPDREALSFALPLGMAIAPTMATKGASAIADGVAEGAEAVS